MAGTSQISGFYKLSAEERIRAVRQLCDLTDEEAALLGASDSLPMEMAEHMIENVIGRFPMPFAVAANFLVNGREYFVPMVIEEPSVVAAASHAAKLARSGGGISVSNSGPIMIAQIQAVSVADPFAARLAILERKDELMEEANAQDPVLIKFGGGVRDIEVRVLDSRIGPMLITHLIVDTRDAMGANTVNTMAEALAPRIESIVGGRVYLRILSNLAVKRLIRARLTVTADALGGPEVIDGIVNAYAFAEADPFRAATHNKGIMNGISAVVLATGNDTRAIEAGAHAYAARSGRYTSLSSWEKNGDGNLVGTLEMPLAVGLVGGATATHPIAKIAVKILGVRTAVELAEVIGAAGLAQNLAAVKVLATEGVQRGHMALHARNIAISAGATGALIDKVAEAMVAERRVRADRAAELVAELGGGKS
jgi:hydroxymethylglutaryl-CoA reductase